MQIDIRLHCIKLEGRTGYNSREDSIKEYHIAVKAINKTGILSQNLIAPLETQLNEDTPNYCCFDILHKSELILSVTDEELISLSSSGAKFSYIKEIAVKQDITKHLIDIAEKPIELVTNGAGNQYNTKCTVHMPGQALSLYNEVMILEDTCTDELQNCLTQNWRIIAACPQPDQRRPDYVLGRYNPKFNCDTEAKRGS